MVPRTVLTRSGPILINVARPVNTVTTVNNAGPMKNIISGAYSTARRPFNKITAANNSNFNKRVNTVNDKNVNVARPNAVVNTARPKAVLSVVKGNKRNAVKASTCWVWRPKHKVLDHVSRNNGASMSFKRFDYGNPQQDLKDKGVIDSGCSRHMTGNRSYLTDYEEIDGGFVAFGGNSKGGKLLGKDSPNARFKPSGEEEKNDAEDLGNEDSEVPKADIKNLDTHIPISPIPTTRIHKDHPVEQIIRDIYSAPQTRRMTKSVTEQAMFSLVQQRTNHKDFQNCLFACFLSQEEPKKVIQALKDPSYNRFLHDDLGVNTAKVRVTAVKHKLVLL
ncbi:hypothetical protein Tco_1374605, partial [Tanacetum coccineum]